ncbi:MULTISPECIES: bifunctional nicotinamidase/pyrazinamidase [unclassified Pseudomonas]|uniref:bifunctional nicotinamidase/pyrazinamidase n=1 Tax=unclassified Pseudomonas TaxID=196821 RepID=UPI002AC954D8|nr:MULTISPECIES: bifunctional nicotinamidase/pyrazinamidase [unclassified Pseudomonas]MEB0041159.1 bifunctional nicotinamidase/pyrazinamidase [Pseudomonas sp. MH10]MEB0078753.1 bifunctional nicotinamidase/pyrazinamidase [Pseudomonas sp. MH10out]MEB0093511.1 bifunctional nicotinamidase/pyrazinamidase [Pseudomonas sp. CCI4.2]MEB0100421.1 bifunctional nicotinamidase/pyrazinamidase [Pseudomonas sp. CCI3.2]MEB0120343.1 bifunctional nicotinamidase/pyrazinamidase [Pseudomonas sp. CCI1.2]
MSFPSTFLPSSPASALLVIDMQNDFMPGGQLAVADGDALVPLINRLGACFRNVVITQDWHPAGHISFASSHAERKPFDSIHLPYGAQTLWPDHCVQGSPGAELHADLDLPNAQLVVRKGYNPCIDSYSAFLEADRCTRTGLAGYLKDRGIHTVFVVGLALDFCVAWSAQDARGEGFTTFVIADACRAIDLNGSLDAAWETMLLAGVQRIESDEVLSDRNDHSPSAKSFNVSPAKR